MVTSNPSGPNLRCKVGDLVILLPGRKLDSECFGLIGTVVAPAPTGRIDLGDVVFGASDAPRWRLRINGKRAVWMDACLQPIRGPKPANAKIKKQRQPSIGLTA